MLRRWSHVLLTAVVAVALLGLAGCHKKETAKAEPAMAESGNGEDAAVDEDMDQEEVEPGPPASPIPTGPVTYPAGEEPLLFQGANVSERERDPGHWRVVYTVRTPPAEVIAFYRTEASQRGWTVEDSQPMPPGVFITWATPHGDLQLIVALSPTGATSVDLNWNESQ